MKITPHPHTAFQCLSFRLSLSLVIFSQFLNYNKVIRVPWLLSTYHFAAITSEACLHSFFNLSFLGVIQSLPISKAHQFGGPFLSAWPGI